MGLNPTPVSVPESTPYIHENKARQADLFAGQTPVADLLNHGGMPKGLTPTCKLVLVYLGWRGGTKQVYLHPVARIAADLDISIRSVKSALATLRDRELLVKAGRLGSNGPRVQLVKIPKQQPKPQKFTPRAVVPEPKPECKKPEPRSANPAPPIYVRTGKTFPIPKPLSQRRSAGGNPRSAGNNPRAKGTNPRRKAGGKPPAPPRRFKLKWWQLGAHPPGEAQMTETERQEIIERDKARRRESLAKLAASLARPAPKPVAVRPDPSVRIEGLAQVRAAIFGAQTRG